MDSHRKITSIFPCEGRGKKQVSILCNLLCNKGESDGDKKLCLLGYAKKKKGIYKKPIVIWWYGLLERRKLWSLLNFLYLLIIWTT